MTTVRIPQTMQVYTNNRDVVHAEGKNVRQLINDLEKAYPGMKDALVEEDKLKGDVAVMLDGKIAQLGILQPVSEENEVIFIPAISGG